jgi:hypothetical protein
MAKTVAGELRRRKDCRIGLTGVEVSLRGHRGERFVVLGSAWDRHGKLRLDVLPVGMLEEYRADMNRHADGNGLVIMRASELVEFADRWADRRIDAPARDAVLLTDWPVLCRCWC